MDIKLEYTISTNEFLEVVESVGWKTYSEEQINKAVSRINQKAISLYDKFGFKEYAVRKNYYGENDAILMKLESAKK
jgi:hypothetical protein